MSKPKDFDLVTDKSVVVKPVDAIAVIKQRDIFDDESLFSFPESLTNTIIDSVKKEAA